MMRVAIVIDSLKVGGAQKLVSAFASNAAAHGLVPVIIILREDNAPFLMNSVRDSGIKLIRLPQAPLFSIGRFRQLVRLLKEERFWPDTALLRGGMEATA